MPIRVGILAEGHDHRILSAFLAKLLEVVEGELEVDRIDGTGHGWQFVERNVELALRRFYHGCARLAVLSMDNDGNLDLRATGRQEDPDHPRHWLHDDHRPRVGCRWCSLHHLAEQTRPHLNWIEKKPGGAWPILIAVPVESIEAWLLIARAILTPGVDSIHAEREQRSTFKDRLYRRPVAALESVEAIALPLIHRLSFDQIRALRAHSRGFDDFATQVDRAREEIETAPDCWA